MCLFQEEYSRDVCGGEVRATVQASFWTVGMIRKDLIDLPCGVNGLHKFPVMALVLS